MKSSHEIKINTVRECASVICDGPEKLVEYWNKSIATADWYSHEREQVIVLALDTKLNVIAHSIVSIGTVNESGCHPRDVFRPAIALNAARIVLMHNHPSGDTAPSQADLRVTRRISEAGDLLQIRLEDHLVVGTPSDSLDVSAYYSFKENGLILS
jgi:DNA repair protein RadC